MVIEMTDRSVGSSMGGIIARPARWPTPRKTQHIQTVGGQHAS